MSGVVQDEQVWRCVQCVGGEVHLRHSGRTVRFAPDPETRRMRGNCGGPFPPDMADALGVKPDIDGVVTITGRQTMAGHDCLDSAQFTSCPNAHIDPLSPGFLGAPWLTEASEAADALGLELRLSDFAPDATGPFRQLVQHIVAERARRSAIQ